MLNTIRSYAALTLLSLSLLPPASAASASNTRPLEQDLAFAFGDSNIKQDTSVMSFLTPQEMSETQGSYFHSRFLFTTFRGNRDFSFPFDKQPNDAFVKPRLKPCTHQTPAEIRRPFFPSRIPGPF